MMQIIILLNYDNEIKKQKMFFVCTPNKKNDEYNFVNSNNKM